MFLIFIEYIIQFEVKFSTLILRYEIPLKN